jgi:hypothetical protein
VVHNLSLVHLLLALGAAACIYLVVRELRRTYVSQWRLFAPVLAAFFVAGGLLLIQLVAGQPRWPFAAAAVVGMAIGVVRGTMIELRHDNYTPTIVIARLPKLVLLFVALGVGLCVVLETIGAFVSPAWEEVRLWAALTAMVCAAAMLGRALVLTIRLRLEHS